MNPLITDMKVFEFNSSIYINLKNSSHGKSQRRKRKKEHQKGINKKPERKKSIQSSQTGSKK
jgi:hypothetical protein